VSLCSLGSEFGQSILKIELKLELKRGWAHEKLGLDEEGHGHGEKQDAPHSKRMRSKPHGEETAEPAPSHHASCTIPSIPFGTYQPAGALPVALTMVWMNGKFPVELLMDIARTLRHQFATFARRAEPKRRLM